MSENENLSCAPTHQIDNWNLIQWRKVIQRVNRLQRRIAKAVKEKVLIAGSAPTRPALKVLEPYAVKVARTVLRGRELPGVA